ASTPAASSASSCGTPKCSNTRALNSESRSIGYVLVSVMFAGALPEVGAQLFEASERLVGVADVEELAALEAIAGGHDDSDEDIFERAAAVRHRPAEAGHIHASMAVPGEDLQRLRIHVGTQIGQHPHRLEPVVAGGHVQPEHAVVADDGVGIQACTHGLPVVPRERT